MRTFLASVAFATCMVCQPAIAADSAAAPSAAPSPPSEQKGIWAAIAYSEIDARHGFFWGADRRVEAGESALEHCRNAGGQACRVVSVFRNHRHWDDDDDSGVPYEPCAALAVGKPQSGETRSWASRAAPTGKEAEDMALAACETDGQVCRVRERVCT